MILDTKKIENIVKDVIYCVPMHTLTTFKIGGIADCVVYPKDEMEIINIIKYAQCLHIPYIVLGNCSNVLVGDLGIEGIVIILNKHFSQIIVHDRILISQSGALLSTVANKSYNKSLGGFEFASGIPGTVGGAVAMNAGAYSHEMKDIVKRVRIINSTGDIEVLTNKQMKFEYRNSIISYSNFVILSVEFELYNTKAINIKAKMDELKSKRILKQPINLPSAGSIFKRPKGYFVGSLIENVGLRGYSIGGASVSKKHAGFIVNDNNASASDVVNLIKYIKCKVYEKSGVMLFTEIKKIGKFK